MRKVWQTILTIPCLCDTSSKFYRDLDRDIGPRVFGPFYSSTLDRHRELQGSKRWRNYSSCPGLEHQDPLEDGRRLGRPAAVATATKCDASVPREGACRRPCRPRSNSHLPLPITVRTTINSNSTLELLWHFYRTHEQSIIIYLVIYYCKRARARENMFEENFRTIKNDPFFGTSFMRICTYEYLNLWMKNMIRTN